MNHRRTFYQIPKITLSVRINIIMTPYGRKKMIYADWIGSGRLYRPIEEKFLHSIGPFVGNTHTGTSENGQVDDRGLSYCS